jgi:hypothetical protein
VLADPALGHHERRVVLGLVIQTMATNQCEAQIVRDESVVPPTMVSFQPIPPP